MYNNEKKKNVTRHVELKPAITQKKEKRRHVGEGACLKKFLP